MENTHIQKKINKKTKTLTARVTDLVARFLGSWTAVIFHTLWFTVWLIFDFNLDFYRSLFP